MTDNEKNLGIIKGLYDWILSSKLFRTNGYNLDTLHGLGLFHIVVRTICTKIEALEPDCDDWLYFGEGSECALSDFIVAAYWACADCHGGQESDTYATMCALGTIFSPGMSSLNDDPESSEKFAYNQICGYLLK